LEQVDLIPPSLKHLQLERFLKNGKSLSCPAKLSTKNKELGKDEEAMLPALGLNHNENYLLKMQYIFPSSTK